MTEHSENIEPSNITKTQLNDFKGGRVLIGKKVEIWVNGKFGRFLSKGVIVDFYKAKGKGKYGSLTITKGQYLIDFGNGKKYWKFRSDFNIV